MDWLEFCAARHLLAEMKVGARIRAAQSEEDASVDASIAALKDAQRGSG